MSLQQTVVSFYSNMYWYSLYKVVFFIMAAVVYGTSEEYFTVMQSPWFLKVYTDLLNNFIISYHSGTYTISSNVMIYVSQFDFHYVSELSDHHRCQNEEGRV